MEFLIYVQEYYYDLIALFCVIGVIMVYSYINEKFLLQIANIITIFFSIYTIYYIGGRDYDIGTDTLQYRNAFNYFSSLRNFEVRRDPLYDILNYLMSNITDFGGMLYFVATIYVFGAWYGLKKIFDREYIFPFLIFLISPYFIAWGVNVMRSGLAASLFLIAIGYYCTSGKDNNKLALVWAVLSVLMHISMIIPFSAFVISRYYKKTSIIFIIWLFSILLGALQINIISVIVQATGVLDDRIANYDTYEGTRSAWGSFFIFGIFPVIFGVYNILVLRYNDKVYKRIVNAYMIAHIPYIVLLSSMYALRLGYLAEFMLPILIFYPLLKNPIINIKYYRIKYLIIIFIVFLIKAYPILLILNDR